jgi:hypothetical protein
MEHSLEVVELQEHLVLRVQLVQVAQVELLVRQVQVV